MTSTTTTPSAPAKAPRASKPKETELPSFDMSDGTAVDASALSTAQGVISGALKAGAAAFIKAGGFSNTVARAIVEARMAITLQSGLPDFGGSSLAWQEVKSKTIDPFYAGLDAKTRGSLQSAVSTALQAHLDEHIAKWTVENREGMPAWNTLSLSGTEKDREAGDKARVVIDAPPAVKKAVKAVYDASNLKPEIGRWGRVKEDKVDKGTQAKLTSAPLNVTEAATAVAGSKVAVDAAAESVRELATALLSAILAAKQIGQDKRTAGEASCLAGARILTACGKALAGKWEGDTDAAAISDALYVTPSK